MFFFFFNKKSDRSYWVNKTLNEVSKNKVTILQGLRRIGKTLIMETVAEESLFKEYEKIAFDAMEFGQDNFVKANAIIETVKKNKLKTYLILIDEFQAIEDWDKFFWSLHKLDNVKIIATGSVSINASDKLNSEGGRYIYIKIPPLSFKEYKIINKESLIKNNTELVFNKYATMGSYPEQEFNENLVAYKKQITNNVLEKTKNNELLKAASIDSSKAMTQVLLYLVENIGQTISNNSISKKLGINVRTIDKIITYLINSFIIYKIDNQKTSKGKAAGNNNKYYLTDHTFYLYQLQSEYQSIKNERYKNAIFENIIFNQLKSIYDRFEIDLRFLVDKTKNNIKDIDMVVKKNDKYHYFEIKNTNKLNALSKEQAKFSQTNALNIIYLGATKLYKNIQYINYIDFIEEIDKWV